MRDCLGMDRSNIHFTFKGEEINGFKLATFYGGRTVINGSQWSLDGFVNSPDQYKIKRIDFFQGRAKEHNMHHVWYTMP